MQETKFERGQAYRPWGLPAVYRAIRRCTWISSRAKLIWHALADHQGETGECYPSAETIGQDIGGVDDRQVRRLIRELEQAGLIRRSIRFQGGRQTSNNIEFLWLPLEELRADSGVRADSRDIPGAGSTVTPGADSGVTLTKSEERTQKNERASGRDDSGDRAQLKAVLERGGVGFLPNDPDTLLRAGQQLGASPEQVIEFIQETLSDMRWKHDPVRSAAYLLHALPSGLPAWLTRNKPAPAPRPFCGQCYNGWVIIDSGGSSGARPCACQTSAPIEAASA